VQGPSLALTSVFGTPGHVLSAVSLPILHTAMEPSLEQVANTLSSRQSASRVAPAHRTNDGRMPMMPAVGMTDMEHTSVLADGVVLCGTYNTCCGGQRTSGRDCSTRPLA
jgi:hypothetical protein